MNQKVPLNEEQLQRQEEVVEDEDHHEDEERFFVDKKLESVEGAKFDGVESTQSIGSAAVVEFIVDQEPQEIDRTDSDIGSQQFLHSELDVIAIDVCSRNSGIEVHETVGSGDQKNYFHDHVDYFVDMFVLVILLLLYPLNHC